MGLDMYAYKIKAEIASDQEIIVDQFEPMLVKAVEKLGISYSEFHEMSWEKQNDLIASQDMKDLYNRNWKYWRKFNALHGWMEDLYTSKGGKEDFNCIGLRINPEDIQKLQADCEAKNLHPRGGFFFGSLDPLTDDDWAELGDFCKDCNEAFAEGYVVFYDSWW